MLGSRRNPGAVGLLQNSAGNSGDLMSSQMMAGQLIISLDIDWIEAWHEFHRHSELTGLQAIVTARKNPT